MAEAIRAALGLAPPRESPGEWIALSSAAAGADLLFVHAALDLGLGWEASLPLPVIDFERDFLPEEWTEVKALLSRAEHLEVAVEPGSRDEAYLTGGFEIVNRCDVLLVVWDGQPARGYGGTADVVGYARAMGRPILIVNPDTKAVRRENFDALRLHEDANLRFLNSRSRGKNPSRRAVRSSWSMPSNAKWTLPPPTLPRISGGSSRSPSGCTSAPPPWPPRPWRLAGIGSGCLGANCSCYWGRSGLP